MKKLILVIAALALIASPALAVDWNFYGSARMATFYISRDYNNGTASDLNGNSNFTKDDDDRVQWDLQGNSRLGATVKAENISGQFEFGVNESDITSRRLYGVWDFGAAKLKVGKDYTPVKQFISGQVFDGDAGLLGNGTAYGGRNGQIALSFGGFEIAAVTNPGNNIRGISTANWGDDKDIYLPKLEAAWGMSLDTWNFKLLGGFNYFRYQNAGPNSDDIDVTSWILGADVGFNFGPAYLKAGGSYGENWSCAGWSGAVAAPAFDGDDDVDDMTSTMLALIGGFKFHDQLTFEAGAGYTNSDSDVKGENSADVWAYYVQAVISMAPGVWIIPEAGYYDYGDDFDGTGKDWGNQFYIGGKWQIDF